MDGGSSGLGLGLDIATSTLFGHFKSNATSPGRYILPMDASGRRGGESPLTSHQICHNRGKSNAMRRNGYSWDEVCKHPPITHTHRLLLLFYANWWSVLSDKCNTAFLILNLPMWKSAEPLILLNLNDIMSLWCDNQCRFPRWCGAHLQQEKLPCGNDTLVTQSVTLSCWASPGHPAPVTCWRGLLCVSWWAHCKLSTLGRIFEACRVKKKNCFQLSFLLTED